MSLNVTVTVDDEWLQKKLKRISEQMKPEAQKAVNVTTIKGLAELKKLLPRRTGVLANSYKSRKIAPLANQIFSPVFYAKDFESGAKPKIINAKPKKMLVFPISRAGKTAKGLLSYTQVRKYFDVVAKRKAQRNAGVSTRNQKPLAEVAKDLGINFAKRGRHPGYAGRWTIRNTVAPHAKKTLREELLKMFGRVNK